ncbi:hypothetical protein J2S21_002530 [Peribacillus cavernae]|nr:hypothetical protein [Peribacillus cavernae]
MKYINSYCSRFSMPKNKAAGAFQFSGKFLPLYRCFFNAPLHAIPDQASSLLSLVIGNRLEFAKVLEIGTAKPGHAHRQPAAQPL